MLDSITHSVANKLKDIYNETDKKKIYVLTRYNYRAIF